MSKMLIVLTWILIVSKAWAGGGVAVGNGGDAIQCAGNPEMFSLDYIQGRAFFGIRERLSEFKTVEESFMRIQKILDVAAPRLGKSFREFVKYLGNAEPSRPIVWSSESDVDDINDEDLSYIPFFCRGPKGSVLVHQAVVRYQPYFSQKLYFKFDADVVSRMSHIQKSFLFVHEWLWSHCNDVQSIRKINYFLHLKYIDGMPANRIVDYLKVYGIKNGI